MTPQSKIKRFLRGFFLGKPHGSSQSCSTPPEENGKALANHEFRISLQRSRTTDIVIPSSRKQKMADCDYLSQSYDSEYSRDGKTTRSMSLQPAENQSLQHLSYREAVALTCEPDCPCDCHNNDAVQMYLTLCRCHMSGYESYRKAVYGGRGFTRRQPGKTEKHNQSKRKSMPDPKKIFGSSDTLGSANSSDTIKACSDYASTSDKSTGSSGGNKSHNSTSPFSLQQLNSSTGFRESELTLRQESSSVLGSSVASSSNKRISATQKYSAKVCRHACQ